MSEYFSNCGYAADAAAFLSETLPESRRRNFVIHLADCQPCVNLLEELAEDEKLQERSLEDGEKDQVGAIVRSAGSKVQRGLSFKSSARTSTNANQPPRPKAGKTVVVRSAILAFSTAAASGLWLWWHSGAGR